MTDKDKLEQTRRDRIFGVEDETQEQTEKQKSVQSDRCRKRQPEKMRWHRTYVSIAVKVERITTINTHNTVLAQSTIITDQSQKAGPVYTTHKKVPEL